MVTARPTKTSAQSPASGADDQVDDLLHELLDAMTKVRRGTLDVRLARRSDLAGQVVDGFNALVDLQERRNRDLLRISRVVGREGRMLERLDEEEFDGAWATGAAAINSLIDDLARPTSEIARVIAAVAEGDLSQHMALEIEGRPLRGEFNRIGRTVNTMVDQLSSFADEVTRVAREVGTEGRLGGQADVRGVSGTWRALTDSVNTMASNLTNQVRSISLTATAIAEGDLSRKITVSARGEIAELAETINSLTDTLRVFADEVTRVAREVGTEGRLGGQAQVPNVAGTWKALTEAVNQLAANLTDQVRNIAQVTTAVAKGDLSQKITVDARGEIVALKDTVNTMVDQLSSFADEVTRVAREVGTEGRLGGQAQVEGVSGTWRDLTESVNRLAANLTGQVRNIAQVTTAVAKGDLSQKITVDAQGEILALKSTVNTMVDQLSSFADEVTRVAREVGTEGKLGGQAQVKGVAGTWRDLTDNVNYMASNLTSQVRNIAQVATAVAEGDLSQKITVDAQGEILALKKTVNTMVDQLSSFADEVTRVAREVGTEGKLGGQAQVKGVAGTWRDLTESVNQLASTLTIQLRAIAGVSTAVTRGDLTQQIGVQASGEVAELKDNINQMIVALRETTRENADQGWLDSNLARIGGLLQGQRDLGEVCQMIMNEVVPLVNGQVGAFFLEVPGNFDGTGVWRLYGGYGLGTGDQGTYARGEGLVGQAGESKQMIVVRNADANFTPIRSGVGQFTPAAVGVLPVLFEGETLGVLEIGSVSAFSELHLTFLERLMVTIGVAIKTIQANRRTEELLGQSQRLAAELQEQSAELQRTNAELEEKAALLSEQNRNIEIKNLEIEAARRRVEENAQQLAQASQYKSEFLANMSHELRTPLNSLLLLARLLADNPEQNLSGQQIEFANTIHNAGSDLLSLIDDILDLSKIEAGRVNIELSAVDLTTVADDVERAFRAQAEEKGLQLRAHCADQVPANVVTDAQRLQQILRNLLSNAVKFTETGTVTLNIDSAPSTREFGMHTLDSADAVVAFSVHDTGIGIPDEKFAMIFEAFQQADGTTSRRYGGTGLGLSISKELARLLGGAITVESELGIGSTFTLYLPQILPSDAVPVHRRSTPPATTADGLPPLTGTPIIGSTAVAATPGRHLDGVTVLIVDDDVRNVFALTSALELHGMTVLYSDNGTDGIRLLTEHPEVDIVLMDAMMPNLDGNQTTQMIRALPIGAQLPVVFLTAKAMPEDRESSLAAGADDYITKPVDLDQLLGVISSWAAQSRTRRAGAVAEGTP
ncbi:MAG TPA: HAMP domain-containing protein [Actinophytocola sp.]|uniref:HAMP domain-containing protein n=1 Tax=Actinophytocola sp. TaxID=1872138 RepID=UPI002DB56B16|nr:HAMP domain-containing protein [Actinophytocola sp.]HEU5471591.1 HAMP domain-containing protein [Actinophytocola sp.]